ncbi:Zinc finger MYM-type protein 1-like [Oopsacas minuta]|uniref:Zinc finger MYM-type protein 1-like n=1 Tax=Oopsacas minuta TaxID=111878 RepID=A0AAV7JJS9_9METZ|nr:Zinc finger MYM-type protein 1-like [Oopsacas minuta]
MALMSCYEEIYEALVTLANDDSQKPGTKVEAQDLTKSIQTLETSLLTLIWQTILEPFHKTTITLQGASTDLYSATALLKGLVVLIVSLRTQFDIFEQREKVTVHVPIITRVVE